MKKKFLVLILAVFMSIPMFADRYENLPRYGKEIYIIKRETILWHATNWQLEMVKYEEGVTIIKAYKLTGNYMTGTIRLDSLTVTDCEDLIFIWR